VASYHLDKAKANASQRDSAHERACNLLTLAELTFQTGQRTEALGLMDDACAKFELLGMGWHVVRAMERTTLLRSI
jgi:hypothetical protein